MWVAKLKLKHDCIIGNRCKKFNIIMQSLDLNERKEKNTTMTSSIHQLVGEKGDIKKFFNDLKKDKRTKYAELNENTLFLMETAKKKPVSEYMKKRIFFVKPTIIDSQGYEYYEIASHEKEELMKFINEVEPIMDEFELLTIKKIPLQNIYFPKIMPKLTDLQKKALELAVKEGYYQIPKKISLRNLAKKMKVSLSTYQAHLQKAESKVIPDILSFLN